MDGWMGGWMDGWMCMCTVYMYVCRPMCRPIWLARVDRNQELMSPYIRIYGDINS